MNCTPVAKCRVCLVICCLILLSCHSEKCLPYGTLENISPNLIAIKWVFRPLPRSSRLLEETKWVIGILIQSYSFTAFYLPSVNQTRDLKCCYGFKVTLYSTQMSPLKRCYQLSCYQFYFNTLQTSAFFTLVTNTSLLSTFGCVWVCLFLCIQTHTIVTVWLYRSVEKYCTDSWTKFGTT